LDENVSQTSARILRADFALMAFLIGRKRQPNISTHPACRLCVNGLFSWTDENVSQTSARRMRADFALMAFLIAGSL